MTAESPEHSLTHDSLSHVRGLIENVGDIWRHEGLKRGVDQLLYRAGGNAIGQWAMDQIVDTRYWDTALVGTLGGISIDSPVGLGAGWDKTGKAILGWQFLGADHTTPGGISLFGQSGNQMPRLRTFDSVVGDHGTTRSLNSFGFYNPGAKKFAYNVARQRERDEVNIPVIVQVTANKEFYEPQNRHLLPGIIATTVEIVKPVADGIELGLTSPNTLGMRDAQSREFTRAIILAAKEAAGDLPLGYKGDGDGGEERLDLYCELAQEAELNWLSLINTTALERIKARYGAAHLPGGLAGGDHEYQDMAVAAVRYVYEAIGDKVDIMGLGGVGFGTSEADTPHAQALRLIRNGASAVGINTGVRHLGARTMALVKAGISDHVDTVQGARRINEVIGIETVRGTKPWSTAA